MTAAAYGDFYESVYRPLVSAYHGRRIAADTIHSEQRIYASEVAAFLEPLCRDRSVRRILDVGGSTGIVAHRLIEEFGASAVVVDPAPLEIDEARGLGLETFSGFIEDFNASPGSFDLCIVCQTIDHFLDVATALTRARKLLADDGLLFVDIVDIRSTWLQSGSVVTALKIDHPFGFVEESAEYGLMRFGFEVVAKEYAPDGLHVRYLCAPVTPRPDLEPDVAAVRDLTREIRRTLVMERAG
jgi:SAM-dependent methyltransferase